jgi:hypothetical protein
LHYSIGQWTFKRFISCREKLLLLVVIAPVISVIASDSYCLSHVVQIITL